MDVRPSESDVELVGTEEMLTMFEQFISDGETSDDGSLHAEGGRIPRSVEEERQRGSSMYST